MSSFRTFSFVKKNNFFGKLRGGRYFNLPFSVGFFSSIWKVSEPISGKN